ncbi:MAG: nucleoside hydrolase-like domain-containing protein [Planctomycetota bacterium]
MLKRTVVIAMCLLGTCALQAQEPSRDSASSRNSSLKPRLVVLTDIKDFEPDDQQSLTRLLSHADLYEIEGIVISTSWGIKDVHEHLDSKDIAMSVIDAYEKDLPNLLKRSNQAGFAQDNEHQEIGYWPSAQYLRDRTMFGSRYRGKRVLGEENESEGSDLIIKLADEDDDRPIWVTFWGGGNTLAQAIWKVQQTRSESELKAFLHKVRAYAINDQDRAKSHKDSLETSSHAWMRREFSDDLLFIWENCAWWYQVGSAKRGHWPEYETHIQNHGHLGRQYPKYRFGVEGDTPSFLHIIPNGLNNPDVPTQVGWGGYSEWGLGEDKNGYSYVNRTGDAHTICWKYAKYFYPASFNNFAARMDWAKEGKGNRNPVVVVNGDDSLDILTLNPKQGAEVKLDASESTDPDGDALSFKWWVQPEAGSYTGTVEITNSFSNQASIEIPEDSAGKTDVPIYVARGNSVSIEIPEDSAGKTFHVICEVTDDGVPNLTSYRRIIFAVQAPTPTPEELEK